MDKHSTVERWSSQRLAEAFPGTSPKLWLESLVPAMIAAGALVKRGRGWLGRRGDIEAALLGAGSSK